MEQARRFPARLTHALRVFYGLSAYYSCATAGWAWERLGNSTHKYTELALAFYLWLAGSIGASLRPRIWLFRFLQFFGFLTYLVVLGSVWDVSSGDVIYLIVSGLFLMPSKWILRSSEIAIVCTLPLAIGRDVLRYWRCIGGPCNFSKMRMIGAARYTAKYTSQNLSLVSHWLERAPVLGPLFQILELGLSAWIFWLVWKRVDLLGPGILFFALGAMHFLVFGYTYLPFMIPVLALFLLPVAQLAPSEKIW